MTICDDIKELEIQNTNCTLISLTNKWKLIYIVSRNSLFLVLFSPSLEGEYLECAEGLVVGELYWRFVPRETTPMHEEPAL